MWWSQRELAFIWSHKTKELPVTSPAPPAARLGGGLGVWGMAVCVCGGGWGGSMGQENDTNFRKIKLSILNF